MSVKGLRRARIAAVVMLVVATMMIAVVAVRFLAFELLNVNGHSMFPTVRHGDRVLVNKLAYHNKGPDRGDIIAFNVEGGRIFVKRVVGLPGDLIEVRNGVLYRDGKKIANEPYVKFHPESRGRRSYRSRTIQSGRLFVMGDNRAASMDSKDFGPIPDGSVIGKAVLIYFPFRRIKRLWLNQRRNLTM